jgi:hypothetical protein
MKTQSPDFFLTTEGEYNALTEPRACWNLGRLRDDRRDDYMLVEIDPPFVDQLAGISQPTNRLLLSSKFEGMSLYKDTRGPLPVYVTHILDPSIIKSGYFGKGQVALIAWGYITDVPSRILHRSTLPAPNKSSRVKWILIGIGLVCLLAVAALFLLPYFATKPLSRDQLMHSQPNPPQPPQATSTPSPAPSPGVKKR